jgi:hypothetical protein
MALGNALTRIILTLAILLLTSAKIDLSNNALTGNIPEGVENLVELSKSSLKSSCIAEKQPKIPFFLTQHFPALLNLEENDLSGPLPELIGNLFELSKSLHTSHTANMENCVFLI